MQANYVNFTINIDGNAYKGMVDLNIRGKGNQKR